MSETLTVLAGKDLSAMVFEHVLGLAAPLFEQLSANPVIPSITRCSPDYLKNPEMQTKR